MKLFFVGLMIALVGAFIATQDARGFTGPVLFAIGASCILFAILG